MFIRRLITVFALFGTGVLIFTGTATAATGSIVYVKNHDVWLANADGSGQYRVTRNGTVGNPWRSPSQADDGTIAASRGDRILRMKQNGTVLNTINPPPLENSVSHMVDGVPVKVAISPNGKLIAWTFVTHECPVAASCDTRPVTGYTAADRLADTAKHGSTYFADPSWIGNSRTLQSGGYGSQVNIHDLGSEPLHWFDDSDYTLDGTDTDLSDAELASDGSRLVAVRGYGGSTHIIWYTVSGNAKSGPAPAVPTPECMTGEQAGTAGPSWSPDSKSLVWERPDGIWLKADVGVCDNPQPKLLIAGGSEPDWGPAAAKPGPRVDDPIQVRQLSRKLKRSLKAGVTFQVKTLGAGKVRLQLRQAGKVVGSGAATTRRAGWVKVTAKFDRKARKKLARVKKVKLTGRFHADGRIGNHAFRLK